MGVVQGDVDRLFAPASCPMTHQSSCPHCGRTFLSKTGQFGKLRCCRHPLPPAVKHVVESPTIPPSAHTIRIGGRALLPCVHRGERAGTVDCGCLGERAVHRCTKLIRPTAEHEPAYCVMYQPVKYFGITLTDGSKLDAHEVSLSEIVICQPGKCDLYQPAVR
jgi:hypothetical protein